MNNAAKDLLHHICLEAGSEESVDLQADPTPIWLPPKQSLLMAQTHFFQQADYATDVFVFQRGRVYSKPFRSANETWAFCSNTVMLLAFGPESLAQKCDFQVT